MSVSVECRNCGESFDCFPSQVRQFCTMACRTAHRRREGGWEQRTCLNCDETFDISGTRLGLGGGTYCSDACRVEYKALPTLTCATCGQEYVSRHRSGFCSKTCAGQARQSRVTCTCRACGVTFALKQSRVASGKGTFCSKACAFPGPVERCCEKCGGAFTASRSEIAKGWARFCSNECRRTRVARCCLICSKPIEVVLSRVAADIGKYCSPECRGLARRNRVVRECAICSAEFERPPSTLRRTPALYCSRACNGVAKSNDPSVLARLRRMRSKQLTQRQPTRPERALYAILDEVLGEGNWAREHFLFDRWTFDAAAPHLRLAFQADGDYWHGWDPVTREHPLVRRNIARDRSQDAYVSKTEWESLRFWEHDLLDRPQWCAEQIQRAVDRAVDRAAAAAR